ncbi:phosphosulfolactate synthase [Oenococcus oeni]|uniref:phosphosulfolactate synthase n=1 Tax=Oenococcus oeni TaxID=1247 RepID=UPI0004A13D6D|nr:phosphosulfolactate synthase [Oenococcus oeni]KDE87671.1 phosphosulfolactate synthase [Oenococcus oeni]
MNAYEFLNLGQSKKPRRSGLTMMLDKGLGSRSLDDLLNTSADYIDFAKFGWGTSAVINRDLIINKTSRYQAAGIMPYPGGTLLEVSALKGKVDRFLKESRELGFTAIEVSDGSTEITKEERAKIIKKSREAGFYVISEVGKKNPILDHDLSISERLELIKSDLAYGSNYVLIEAREARKDIGIYDADGNIIEDELEQLSSLGISKLIFEAPLKKQQAELILKFGSQINLGNIASDEVVSLETLRQGLRGDTISLLH